MRYAVISDIHSNLEALKAVLTDIKNLDITEVLFAGDAVGYGPDPRECLKIIESECNIVIAGNHDWAVLGLLDISSFNSAARSAIRWTMQNITEENIQFLKKFRIIEILPEINVFLVHSTPKDPQRWSYLLTLSDIAVNFDFFDEKICFLGHSHIPFIAEKEPDGEIVIYKKKVLLSKEAKYIVNAGSVGQPRDGNPKACYCIFDEGLIYFRRVEYDIAKTQDKMKRYGLPTYLIERLSYGI